MNHTTASYDKINGSMEKLMMHFNYISESVENMEVSRVSTLGLIEIKKDLWHIKSSAIDLFFFTLTLPLPFSSHRRS